MKKRRGYLGHPIYRKRINDNFLQAVSIQPGDSANVGPFPITCYQHNLSGTRIPYLYL